MIFIYIVLLIIAVMFYILFKGVISFLILGLAIALPIAMLTMLMYSKHKITAELSIASQRCSVGENVPVNIRITNPTVLPVLNCEISLEFILSSSDKPERVKINTPIFPSNKQNLSVAFCSEHFGIISCRIGAIKIFDMLKIFRTTLGAKNLTHLNCSTMILPEILLLENSISDYSDLGLDSEKFSNTKPGDDPSEIFAVREYKDGDKPSKIHWKLTAKANELMVKDYSLPLADSFLILTDTYIPNSDRKAEIYDTEIQLVASVSNLFLENQARHKIAAYNEKEQAFFEQTVSDEESFISACSELLSCGSCNSPSLAAKALLSDDENTARYGHMIFVTANFDRRIVDMLVSSGTAFRYTIMLCTDGEDLSKTAELDSNAQIIPIRSGRIEQSLAEIVF